MAAAVASYREPLQKDYSEAADDFLRDLPLSDNDGDLGGAHDERTRDIDQEIKVSKKRKAVAKLDAERLLSERGVPELRRRAAKRLKFQGKGHEYTDMARLMTLYQMWLDDLYPRAKFRDGLSLVEKVGHTKRLQVMRKGWMDATRPSRTLEDDEREEAARGTEAEGGADQHNTDPVDSNEPDEDELDALMAADAQRVISTASAEQQNVADAPNGDPAYEDDLDALLDQEAGDRGDGAGITSIGTQAHGDDRFADDEEAMAEMGYPF